jgi:hypothetical protein
MIKEDLDYIFKSQITEGTELLYFMLIDGDHKLIQRHPADKLEDLLPCLDCYQFDCIDGIMPRFIK